MPTELTVTGMTCQGCEAVVEKAIEMADNVESADADRYEDSVVVETTGDVDPAVLTNKVELAGYTVDG